MKWNSQLIYISVLQCRKAHPIKDPIFLGYFWNTELQPISLLQTDTLGNNHTTLMLARGEGKTRVMTKCKYKMLFTHSLPPAEPPACCHTTTVCKNGLLLAKKLISSIQRLSSSCNMVKRCSTFSMSYSFNKTQESFEWHIGHHLPSPMDFIAPIDTKFQRELNFFVPPKYPCWTQMKTNLG